MIFGLMKKAIGGAKREVTAEYGANKDFLEAVCAASALVAAADGEIEESEKKKTISLISNHKDLGRMYKQSDIESTADTMFKRAKDQSGKQQIARELDDIKDKKEMCQDVYYIALDIAHSDGEVDAAEEKVLKRIADILGVDSSTEAW